MDTQKFQELVWRRGQELYRPMPWRDQPLPYYVLVSELMLQQTQVSRVIPKFEAFVARFPTLQSLSESSLADVLILWSGLGYNRRAKFLWQAAQQVSLRFAGELPRTYHELVSLPGIGPNTAGAILNYAYEIPMAFIETNIRTVYFYHFFEGQGDVTDRELRAIVNRTMDQSRSRAWHWALMDYGAHLKSTGSGRLNQSKHYKKQSPLKGSQREMRGRIIRELTGQPLSTDELRDAVRADERFEPALKELTRECMVVIQDDRWRLGTDKG